ncbi:MAG: ATP-binding protein [Chromatiales bacterium]
MPISPELLNRIEALLARIEPLLPPARTYPDWRAMAYIWRREGFGGYFQPVTMLSKVRLDDLLCIDDQKRQIETNTRQFLASLPANNVLLWGPRGTGKSSLIKALLNEYASHGLRMVEVEREHLTDLPDIVDQLARRPERFIVFCDDLSFEANDGRYKAIKVLLDGSVHATPENVLVYATSNRRHLLPEQLSDNLAARVVDGEVHQAEAVEEKISLSERFGLWLAFHPFNQEEYLDIVDHWLGRLQVSDADRAGMREAALQWALLHGSRSGRSGWQFAKDWAGRKGLAELDEASE